MKPLHMKPTTTGRSGVFSVRAIGLAVFASLLPHSSIADAGAPLRLLAELSGDESAMSGFFGSSIALTENMLVVGAHDDSGIHPDTGLGFSGSVTVFRRGPTRWTIEAKLLASDATVQDNFGVSVAIDEDLIVVGSSEHRDPFSNQQIGGAYVFRREAFSWFEEAKLTPSDGAHGGDFGFVVDIQGDRILVGAPQFSKFGAHVGAGYVFRHQDEQWTEEARLSIDPQFGLARMGISIANSGEDVLIGAWGPNSASDNSGAVYRYRSDGKEWRLIQRLQQNDEHVSDEIAVDRFSWQIDTDGNTLIVGAPGDNRSNGAAILFDLHDDSWLQHQRLPNPLNPAFHNSFGGIVAVSGGFAVVSSWQDTLVLYHREGDEWVNQGEFLKPNGEPFWPGSLAMNGRLLAIGAAGAPVFIYDLCPTDINADGVTNPADLSMLLDDFGTGAYPTDLNNDGIVDTADLGLLLRSFGKQCP